MKGKSTQISPNLLRTCKMIHREARPIFYSGNHFVIQSEHLRLFLPMIGFSTQHLTSVTMELSDFNMNNHGPDTWCAPFVQLARLVGLQELKIRVSAHAESLYVGQMVSKLLPTVRNMRTALSQTKKGWTDESLGDALTFSMHVKPCNTGCFRGPRILKAERDRITHAFPKDVLAALEEMSLIEG